MQIDLNQLTHSILGSGWLLPLLGLGGWILRNYLKETFITINDFNAYKEARGEEEKEYREFIKAEFEEKQEYLKVLDKRSSDNGKEVARLEGKLDK